MKVRRGARSALLPVLGALVISLAGPLAAFAHGGGTEPTVELDPPQVTAGGTVTVVGEKMEPDSDRVIVLTGQQLTVEFGTVRTDADGMFTLVITVPAHLPGGLYQVQAIGDETISADLAVTAAAGMPATEPGPQEKVQPRHLEGLGLVLLILVIGLLVLAGGWLVVSAERLAGHHTT
jgi:hypothetical protein